MALAVAPRRLWDWLNDANTRKWVSILTLGAAVLVLAFVLVWTGTALSQPSAARCSNAPARVTSIPQLTEVAICVAGFILGRITARPKIRSRGELRDSTVEREVPALLRAQVRARAAVWAQASLTAALLFITFLLAFETLALARSAWPITYYTRCANEAAPLRTLASAFAFCFLAGRWLWLPASPKDET